mgnify:FL=1
MANVYRSLDFVTREHPELHARLLDIEDGLANLVLQLVLDSRRTNQIKFHLELLGNLIDCFLFIQRGGGSLVLGLPGLVLVLTDLLRRY